MTALHPDVQWLLDLLRSSGRPPLEGYSPVEGRVAYAASRGVLGLPADAVAEVRELRTPSGIGLRLYRPLGSDQAALLPGVLFLHGGGWVLGDLESHDPVCRRLANLSGCAVLAVEYRLAPEHVFPAAVEDCAEAMRFLAGEAAALGVDPSRLAVAGDSAGGNLAAVLALMARDGDLPAPGLQLLFYPVTDLMMTGESYQRTRPDLPLTGASMRYFIDHYTPDPAARVDWRASPGRAPSLAGAAPALVVTAGHDPLCDEARLYAYRLERDGVPVTSLHLSDYAHGFLTMGGRMRAATGVLAYAADALKTAFA